MQGEGDSSVSWFTRLVIPMHQLDVNILIECPRESIAWTGKNAPPTAVVRRAGDCRVVGGITESEERKALQGPIEQYDARGDASTRGEAHAWESDAMPDERQAPRRQYSLKKARSTGQ
jgi:hypothetical protein